MYCAYRKYLADFLDDAPSSIVGLLHQSAAEDGFSRMWTAQTSAWLDEVACLQTSARQLIAANAKAAAWTILLEYEIARRGRRIDAVLLTDTMITVLEFKVGLQAADSASRWQAYEYGLDLRDFHDGSRNHPIVPIVVPTGSPADFYRPSIAEEHGVISVHKVIECSPRQLAATILAVDGRLNNSTLLPIDPDAWSASSYRPSLNIIEAAERVFSGQEVREISHSTATNLSCTVDAIIRCVTEAHRNRLRLACFVTGVPGAGKTLAGLSAVHNPVLRDASRPSAVFLSGNGPLVKIVRAALARDLRRRLPDSEDGPRQVAAFIQNVHGFLGHYAFKALEEAPPEHVVIFDEAQRAWDGKQMARRKRGDKSEAALMLDVMARCQDWSVIVALVGFGQEIHQGEAGLQEWGRAIALASPSRSVLASPLVLDASDDQEATCLFPPGVPPTEAVECNADLHLRVSIRSHRAQMVSEWVKFVLQGNAEAARQLFAGAAEFPVALTRDLAVAREWLRAHSEGCRQAGSCGLLASSGAIRLRAYGIEVSTGFRQGYPYEEWFLRASDDTRSSSALEVAATEFECQGLEVDWAGVCWGDDMAFDPETGQWDPRKFVGNRWTASTTPVLRRYILNKYRVLLTRARRGFVIWIPPGDLRDQTRKPRRLDVTADFLIQCGIKPI